MLGVQLANRPRYNFSPQYHRADFDVKIIVGAADLKFQLWGRKGQMSKDHDDIEVMWNPASTEVKSNTHMADDMSGMYKGC
jgi:hypothetical protein